MYDITFCEGIENNKNCANCFRCTSNHDLRGKIISMSDFGLQVTTDGECSNMIPMEEEEND